MTKGRREPHVACGRSPLLWPKGVGRPRGDLGTDRDIRFGRVIPRSGTAPAARRAPTRDARAPPSCLPRAQPTHPRVRGRPRRGREQFHIAGSLDSEAICVGDHRRAAQPLPGGVAKIPGVDLQRGVGEPERAGDREPSGEADRAPSEHRPSTRRAIARTMAATMINRRSASEMRRTGRSRFSSA
jgi:hypothetical protein